MNDDIKQQIRQIKQSFRLVMDGSIAQSMRDKGVEYHLNWGATVLRLREKAEEIGPNYDLAVALVLRGHEVRVITQDTDTGKHGAVRLPVVSADGEGGTGKFIQACYFHWPEFFGHPLVKSENLEKHIRWADVVHTSTFTPSPPVSKLCKKYHKPCVLTIHEFHGFKWFWVDTPVRAAAFFLFEWYVCTRKFDVYHAVSDATKKDFIKLLPHYNFHYLAV